MGCSALSCVAVSTSPFKRVILPGRSPVPVRRRPCPPLSAFLPRRATGLPPSGSPVAAFRVNGVTQPVSPRLVPVTQHSVSFPVDPCRGVEQFATPPGDCTARPRVKAHTPFGHQLVAGWFRVFRYSSCRRERLCGRDVPSSWVSRTSVTGRWVPGRLRSGREHLPDSWLAWRPRCSPCPRSSAARPGLSTSLPDTLSVPCL